MSSERWKWVFTAAGSTAGIVALLWNVYWTVSNAQTDYVQLALQIQPAGAIKATALETVENKGVLSKPVDYAALVISPVHQDIRSVVDVLRSCTGTPAAVNILSEPASSVLAYIPKSDEPVYCDGETSLIPLTFFYREQRQIGTEKLSSRTLIDLNSFRYGKSPHDAYEVRFIVAGQGRVRATLDLLLR